MLCLIGVFSKGKGSPNSLEHLHTTIWKWWEATTSVVPLVSNHWYMFFCELLWANRVDRHKPDVNWSGVVQLHFTFSSKVQAPQVLEGFFSFATKSALIGQMLDMTNNFESWVLNRPRFVGYKVITHNESRLDWTQNELTAIRDGKRNINIRVFDVKVRRFHICLWLSSREPIMMNKNSTFKSFALWAQTSSAAGSWEKMWVWINFVISCFPQDKPCVMKITEIKERKAILFRKKNHVTPPLITLYKPVSESDERCHKWSKAPLHTHTNKANKTITKKYQN